MITPAHLVSIIESYNFGTLLQAIGDSSAMLLGADQVGEASLILFDEGPATGWLLNSITLHKRHIFRPCHLPEDWVRSLWLSGGIQLLDESPGRLLQTAGGEAIADEPAVKTVAVPLATDEQKIGLLLIPLGGAVDRLGAEAEEGLLHLAQTLSRVAPRILLHERTDYQNQQMHHLQEGMIRALMAPNRSSLQAALLLILNRHFGLSRIIIAQVQAENRALRSELHSGFGPDFAPFAIPLENAAHPFIQAMTRGDALIYETARGGFGEQLPDFLKGTRVERRVILPLLIGLKPVGLIYADQPVHDGTPFFRNVFEVFARMAAAAMENLNLRLRAEQRAETDALTGLYNRSFLDRILEIEIPRVKRYNHSISLLMLDLCDFKHFNDTYGHQFGDYILRETASLLQAHVRRPDIVVRYGGDEFVVLMVNTSHEQALLVKNRIEQAFIERNRMQTDERALIKISIGLRSANARTIEGLLHAADMEMYAHKAHQTRLLLIEGLLSGSIEKIEAADRIVGSLCNILYKKAPYYPEHARRVAHIALTLALRLGMTGHDVENLALAALLHDVGKVSIPTEILQKTEPLDPAEIAALRHHPALGEEFFQGIEHLEPVRPIIRAHHERYDGQITGDFPGYPDGLCGERIPLAARILKLAESVDCMLFGLPYRPGSPPEIVAAVVREESGKSFDPRLVSLLLSDKNWHHDLGEADRISDMINLEV